MTSPDLTSGVTPRDGVVGRYAPSPSGPQHLGNLRTALAAWLHARLHAGRFIVRMEDLDRPRVRAGSAEQILDDLAWIGLDWDEGPDRGGPGGPYTQSERLGIYGDALDALRLKRRVFACYCSRKDIRELASAPHGPEGLIYPGTCRDRADTPTERAASWRMRVDDAVLEMDDQVQGSERYPLETLSGDFVVQRADGVFAYQLAVAVDDALMGVTDVVRGGDLLSSTPRQVWVLRGLGLPAPRYWHVPVMTDERGERLSKRDGSESLDSMRARGESAESLVGKLAFGLGLLDKTQSLSTHELLAELDPAGFADALRAAARTEP